MSPAVVVAVACISTAALQAYHDLHTVSVGVCDSEAVVGVLRDLLRVSKGCGSLEAVF